MKTITLVRTVALLVGMLALASCTRLQPPLPAPAPLPAETTEAPSAEPAAPPPAARPESQTVPVVMIEGLTGSVSRGAQLYDKWWAALGVQPPTEDHPLWASQTTNTRSGSDTWRCKECHGWDYLGKDGAYGSGSHKTGFPGIFDARNKSTQELVAALTGQVNPKHDFSTVLDDQSIIDLVTFIQQGLIDERQYIDYQTQTPLHADLENGKILFQGACAECHGPDGTALNFGSAEEPEYVGTLAKENPQEFLHKARFGQVGSDPEMAITHDWGWSVQDAVDLLTYAQTLPDEPE